jgi:LmbE family N-acetylglucosaminyl deacetylase
LAVVLGLALVLSIGRAGTTRHSSYFPETGKPAIHQRALDLSSSAVVLVVALQPGYEDLPLLACLRMAVGARVAVAYMTNGETTPSDDGGMAAELVAGERKEEAFSTASFLDVTTHFLNLPDPGIVGLREALTDIWGVDTLLARLRKTIRYFRPNVVLIEGDLRGDTVRSIRQQVVAEFVLKAIEAERETGSKPKEVTSARPWPDTRVFLESEGGKQKSKENMYDRLHPVWKKSYRAIASEAAKEYRSLKLQLDFWMQRGDRRYISEETHEIENLQRMLSGLPHVSPEVLTLGVAIQKVTTRNNGAVRAPILREVMRVIDTLDIYLARNRTSLTDSDLRLLAGWKNGLESLRCSLLDVRVSYAATDSLVSDRQLLYLKFDGLSSHFSQRGSKIYFPGAMDHKWGVNESVEYQFPFQAPQQFEILTPEHMDYTYPAGQFGIRQSAIRNRFSFLLVHNDSVRQRNFLYRGEVLLRAGPKRTFEVLTPVVRVVDGQPIIFRMTNISRDPFQGTLTIEDTLVKAVSKTVHLKGKDAVVVDSLKLIFSRPLAGGDYHMEISLAGETQGSFVARSFEARIDSQARIALVTGLDESPVAQGLDRLGLRWWRMHAASIEPSTLKQATVILIDRDALAGLRGLPKSIHAIMAWVRSGGHVVVLPQNDVAEGGAWFFPGTLFRRSVQLPPNTAVHTDSADRLLSSPNVVSKDDWDGWLVARSECSVDVAAGREAHVIVSAAGRNLPLVVTLPEGKGQVTLVALDIVPQLINIHPGVHRLFANLLTGQL